MKVTVPEVVLLAPAVPARLPVTLVLLWKSKAVVLVKTPPAEPVIVPPVSFTPLTVSVRAPMLKVPPVAISTLEVFLIWSDAPRVKLPVPLTSTSPAMASTVAVLASVRLPAPTVVRPE